MDHEERAKSLMKFYFRLIAERAGVRWNFDNDSEIDELVDHLIAAAQPGPLSLAETIAANADAARLRSRWTQRVRS